MTNKNMAYWKAKNGVAPAGKNEGGPLKMKASPFKQIQPAPADTSGTSYYPYLLNERGQHGGEVLANRQKAIQKIIDEQTDWQNRVEEYAKQTGGLTEAELKRTEEKQAEYKLLFDNAVLKDQSSRDSITNITNAENIKIQENQKLKDDLKTDLFD